MNLGYITKKETIPELCNYVNYFGEPFKQNVIFPECKIIKKEDNKKENNNNRVKDYNFEIEI